MFKTLLNITFKLGHEYLFMQMPIEKGRVECGCPFDELQSQIGLQKNIKFFKKSTVPQD
jgi:hypothetical protein